MGISPCGNLAIMARRPPVLLCSFEELRYERPVEIPVSIQLADLLLAPWRVPLASMTVLCGARKAVRPPVVPLFFVDASTALRREIFD